MARVKIRFVASIAEAHLAIAHGDDALGLVARMPSGPGPIADQRIASIAAAVPPPTHTFLLSSETSVRNVAAHQARTRPTTIQLVDALQDGGLAERRATLPGGRLVQVVHMRDAASVDEALRAAEHVDHVLLDPGDPGRAVKELGGTGRTHDGSISRRIVDQCPVPVFLAGGLSPGNVARAIALVRPHGVDVCSGVRTGAALDPLKLAAFVAAVRAA